MWLLGTGCPGTLGLKLHLSSSRMPPTPLCAGTDVCGLSAPPCSGASFASLHSHETWAQLWVAGGRHGEQLSQHPVLWDGL